MYTNSNLVCVAALVTCWFPSLFFDGSQLVTLALVAVAAAGVTLARLPAGRLGLGLRCLSFGALGGAGVAHSLAFALGSHGFDAAFFWHVEPGSIEGGVEAYPYVSAAALAALIAVTGLPLVARPTAAPRGVRPWLLISIGTLLNPALLQAYKSLHVADGELNVVERLARSRLVNAAQLKRPERPKNIVILYIESLERAWLDETRMGKDLLPRLRASESEALVFDGLRQMPGTSWTVAGTFASQCGLPLSNDGFGSNQLFASAHGLTSGIVCLGDVLHKAGYDTHFLQGGSAEFSGTGKFLRSHGFSQVEGKVELAARVSTDIVQTRWGYHDENVLDLAFEAIEQAGATGRPFLVAAATVDTHPPAGALGPSCGSVTQRDDRYMDVVRCADLMIDRFLSRMRASPWWNDTVIVVMSDHLTMDFATLIDKLTRGERHLLFDVFGGSIQPGVHHGSGTHFDIAPTVLELAGFRAPLTFPLGQSLVSHEQGFVADAKLSEHDVASVLLTRVDRRTALLPDELRVVRSKNELWVGKQRIDLRMDGVAKCFDCYKIVGFDRYGTLRRLQFQKSWTAGFESGETDIVVAEHSERLLPSLGADAQNLKARGRGVFVGAPREGSWRWYALDDELVIPKSEVALATQAAANASWFAFARGR